MQQLLVEFKNTSGDAPQVPCSVSEALNREETLSLPRKVLANNSSAQDPRSGKRGQTLSVPVINMRGKPLMPTTPGKARIQPNDLVKYLKTVHKVKGIHSYGKYVILVDKVGKFVDINVKKVELVKHGKGIQF